jgi:leader peptidase (prepilin peptidase)/N-methyltransferase
MDVAFDGGIQCHVSSTLDGALREARDQLFLEKQHQHHQRGGDRDRTGDALHQLEGVVVGEQGPFVGPWDALVGACVGAGLIAIVGWLGEVAMGREAMGEGDATLMAMIGAMVGVERSFLTVFVAAGIGAGVFLLVVAPIGWVRARSRGEEYELPLVPFGVFLAPAGIVTLLFGDAIIARYFSLVA